MRQTRIVMIGICFCIMVIALTSVKRPNTTEGVKHTLKYIKSNISLFIMSTKSLKTALQNISKDSPSSLSDAIDSLKKSRMQYKKIAFFMTYFFRTSASVFNNQPNYEVEEPSSEYIAPSGFQVIAAILFSVNPYDQKKELQQQANLVEASAEGLYSLLFTVNMTDSQILESIHLGIIRLIALGITGYDAQELKTGIVEAGQVLTTFKKVLRPYLFVKYSESDSVSFYLDTALEMVRKNNNFDTFDRMKFLTNAILPLEFHLGQLIKQENLELNSTGGVLNYNAGTIFSPGFIRVDPNSNPNNWPIFPTQTDVAKNLKKNITDSSLVKLGAMLFSETALSGNYSHSCASCHEPDRYFTDGLPKGIAYDGVFKLKRNTPTLLYAGCQYSQFLDGRANSLDSQIRTVLKDPLEMHSSFHLIISRLQNNKQYIKYFTRAFPMQKDTSINISNITTALSAYIETLSPFNSSFDQYMNGDGNALTKQQIEGFNLFTGKAQCATCHFIPVFNGLLPPFYDKTELENVGLTADTDFTHPELNSDSGRFSTTPAKYYMRKFKVSTTRDIARTGPYMSNGTFPTLKSVVVFYNKGGGAGMGLSVPNQTLSPKPLGLTKAEIDDLVDFMNSLTDSLPSKLTP